MPNEDMVQHFNELRQDIVLLYELKLALASCEYDQQMLHHRHDTLNPNSKVSALHVCVWCAHMPQGSHRSWNPGKVLEFCHRKSVGTLMPATVKSLD